MNLIKQIDELLQNCEDYPPIRWSDAEVEFIETIKQCREALRWISVSEGLPDEYCECLCITESGHIYLDWYFHNLKRWENELYTPTHWRIPSPPEGSEGDE